MKKRIILPLIALMMLVLSMAACADSMYADKDTVKVYKEKSTDSKVLKKLKGGQAVQAGELEDNNKWVSIMLEDVDQGYGYVRVEDMSFTMPSQYCKHDWSGWTVYTQPTCTENGMEVRECSICGVGEGKDIPALGHDFGDWTVERQATCTQEGLKSSTCRRCGAIQAVDIPKADHKYGDWSITRQPTCTAEGERTRKCSVCGQTETQTIEKLPHDFGSWTVLTEATCTAEGAQEHTCKTCGFKETATIAKLPHSFEVKILEASTDHSSGVSASVCKVCGYSEEPVTFDPEGTVRRGDRTDASREIQQLLADQGYLSEGGVDGVFGGGTEAALMEFQKDQGLTADGIAWPQTIKRLRHDFGPWSVLVPETRLTPGERVRVCKDCDYEQHETFTLTPYMERGQRGEDVRTAQQMLAAAGFDAGSADGIYGQRFDDAFTALSSESGIEFEAGKVYPAHFDALVSKFIASASDEQWKGAGSSETPVNLILTVTPVETVDEVVPAAEAAEAETATEAAEEAEPATEAVEEAEPATEAVEETEAVTEAAEAAEPKTIQKTTYSWTLTNMGSEPCRFAALLLSFGEDPDFKAGSLVMALDGETMEANCGNVVSGTFTASSDWGEAPAAFSALGTIEGSGEMWLSNTEIF